MVRGIIKFECPKCGKIFKSLDLEQNCTVYSMPMPCPKCGTLSEPATLISYFRHIFLSKR